MTLYFAYGSNMSRALMARRCPSAIPRGTAHLRGWRYIIGRDGYASIVPCSGAAVHGVLWRLQPRDLAALNAYESLDSGLYLRRILCIDRRAERVAAMVYIGRGRAHGRPKPGYQEHIVLPSAREWALPQNYLAQLARWRHSATPRLRHQARARR